MGPRTLNLQRSGRETSKRDREELTSVRRNKKGSDVLEARERCFKNKAVLTKLLVLLVKKNEGALTLASAEVLGNLDKSKYSAVKRR